MTITSVPGLLPGVWTIDPVHSEIGFSVRHLMSKVRGTFREFEGTVEVAEDVAASRATATVKLASIDTGNQQRDDHLRSSDFLEIDKYPEMTFVSTGLRPNGDDPSSFILVGDLTLKGVTRQIELSAEFLGVDQDPFGETRAGFEATGKINRKDFGVNGNVPLSGEKFLIGDEVTINITVEAVFKKD
jgi:polyisoprenoid-binding protein YceI